MLFNSFTFIFFFVIVLVVYYLSPHRFRWLILLTASTYFYMHFIPVYVLILAFLILLDYFCAIRIEESKNKLLALRLSLTGNILLLAFFKYWNFLNDNLVEILKPFGAQTPFPWIQFALPVGLSFHTFQSMGYTIDVYKGKIKAERHAGYYALFVMFFPQLVAGPIERAGNLLQQLKTRVVTLNYSNFIYGFSLMLRGFVKKIVIADQLAIYVDSVYDHAAVHNGFTLVLATWFFAFQIYCDFSGYSDIAIGAAKMLGYDMSMNFNLPYFSKSITEFWRRWHITLSFWLRDYVYIPLGGNRKGKLRTYVNLMGTMLLGGLWHGSSWNFVIWGGIHGLYLSAEKALGVKVSPVKNILARGIRIFIVFNLVCFAWIFFRAETFAQSSTIIKNIPVNFFSLSIRDTGVFANCVFALLILAITELLLNRRYKVETLMAEEKLKPLYVVNFVFVLLILTFSVNTGAQFIYFQF